MKIQYSSRYPRYIRPFKLLLVITAMSAWMCRFPCILKAETVQTRSMYTYPEMMMDIAELKSQYPTYITAGNIGTSVLGRYIPYFTIGNTAATKKVCVTASIHGREYIASQVVMRLAEEYISECKDDVLNNACLYIVPMVNPDGVMIAQKGADHVSDEDIRAFIENTGHYDEWKANANGIDLNRNFHIGWKTVNLYGTVSPSYAMWKGELPETEPETIALRRFAESGNFSKFVNLHQQGEVIYYGSGLATDGINAASSALAVKVNKINGYAIIDNNGQAEDSYGTFADFVCVKLKKPSITLELGTKLGEEGQPQTEEIIDKNRELFKTIAK